MNGTEIDTSCPACSEEIPPERWMKTGGALAGAKAKRSAKKGNSFAKKKRDCEFCGNHFSAREMIHHVRHECKEAAICPVCRKRVAKSKLAPELHTCQGPPAGRKK